MIFVLNEDKFGTQAITDVIMLSSHERDFVDEVEEAWNRDET